MNDEDTKRRPLREWREQRQITQFDLAVKSQVSLSTVRAIEANQRTPNVVIAERIAAVLGVTVYEIRWPQPGELASQRANSADASEE